MSLDDAILRIAQEHSSEKSRATAAAVKKMRSLAQAIWRVEYAQYLCSDAQREMGDARWRVFNAINAQMPHVEEIALEALRQHIDLLDPDSGDWDLQEVEA